MSDLHKTLRELQRKGWTVLPQPGHYKLYSPQGQLFTCSSSPSCPHAHKRLLNDIRKYQKHGERSL